MSRRTAALAIACVLIVLLFLFVREGDDPPATPRAPTEARTDETAPRPSEPAPPAPEPGGEIEGPLEAESPPVREGDRTAGRSLTGRVVRADGTPVEGAVVSVFGAHDDLLRKGVTPIRGIDKVQPRARTGKDGRFSFGPDTPGALRQADWSARMRVRAEAPGAASWFVSLADHLTDLVAPDLVLLPAIEPEGVVVDGDGRPVADARVVLSFIHSLDPGGSGGEQYTLLADRSDEEGRVRFVSIPGRDDWSVRLTVEHADFLNTEREIPAAETASGLRLRAVLTPGLIVRGVLLFPDGAPAAGYDVHVGRRRGLSLYPVAQTGEDGSFVARGVPVRAGAVAFEKKWDDLEHKIDVPAGKDGEAVDLGTIRLPGGATIRGRVLDEDGEPVRCRVNLHDPKDYSGYKNAKVDREGRFTFKDIPPGKYEVKARHDLEGGDEIEGKVSGVEPGDEDVTVRLSRAGSVLFVFHPADRPDEPLEVPGYEIRLKWGSWSGTGRLSRMRVYFQPREEECRFTVKLPGFVEVELDPVRVRPDDETVVDVYLTPE